MPPTTSFAPLLMIFGFVALAQQPTPQAPSPMVDHTRPHPRIQQTEVVGRRVDLKTLKGAQLFVSPRVNPNSPVPLLIHFHGAPWLVERHVSLYLPKTALINVQLGAGSGVYRRPFEDPKLFLNLLRESADELHLSRGWSSITLSGFSAGYGAVREILRQPENFARVNTVLLLDGMHTSYVPEGKPLAVAVLSMVQDSIHLSLLPKKQWPEGKLSSLPIQKFFPALTPARPSVRTICYLS